MNSGEHLIDKIKKKRVGRVRRGRKLGIIIVEEEKDASKSEGKAKKQDQ